MLLALFVLRYMQAGSFVASVIGIVDGEPTQMMRESTSSELIRKW
jgi:hypothetical protein